MSRRYSATEKSDAIGLAATIGQRPAAERLGIPAGTLASWIRRSEAASVAVGAAVDKSLPWGERRVKIVDDLSSLSVEFVDAIRLAVAAGRLRDARDGAVGLAVCIDKAQLLSGQATERTESVNLNVNIVEARRQRIADLEESLGITPGAPVVIPTTGVEA